MKKIEIQPLPWTAFWPSELLKELEQAKCSATDPVPSILNAADDIPRIHDWLMQAKNQREILDQRAQAITHITYLVKSPPQKIANVYNVFEMSEPYGWWDKLWSRKHVSPSIWMDSNVEMASRAFKSSGLPKVHRIRSAVKSGKVPRQAIFITAVQDYGRCFISACVRRKNKSPSIVTCIIDEGKSQEWPAAIGINAIALVRAAVRDFGGEAIPVDSETLTDAFRPD